MDRWIGKVAVVTGASVGIGEAIVKKLVSHGMKVVGCARNEKKLKQIASEINGKGQGEMFPFKCDVTDESNILEMFKFVEEKFGKIHVLVNNAGLAHEAPVTSGKTEEWKRMLDVNVLGLSICVRETVQIMKSTGVDDGHIINISSVAGHKVGDKTMYAGTKFAVRALTEGLRKELREAKTHIKSTSVSPGFVATEFAYRLYEGEPERAQKLYSKIVCLKAEDVAEAVAFALSTPAHVDINEITMRPVEQTN
uniref:Dehydrogenase/reductase SDR family member 11 n=1 Tax=Ciona intestinalis TaxID=7719 RepID=F6PUC9_CIOIN|nr:dehydrogenase/reductase SDR family member 11-like [Ciona intestinalis]|eukprot:XP_002130258.1 dehydrogenase/reductase SDR family member 11-like [Ciona intestinalis]